jgi:predicted nuclease with TOPRIM domain
MDSVFERIRQLSRLREDAEAARFERADEEREGKVAELDDKQDEMEEAFERLKEERREDAHRFRQMRNLLVAL